MKKVTGRTTLIAGVLFLITACNGDNDVSSIDTNSESGNTGINVQSPPTYFNGSIDGEAKMGGGVAFVRESDSSLHIRGLLGTPGFYYQVDIGVPESAEGTYQFDSAGASGSVTEIIGQDAAGQTFNATGGVLEKVTFDWGQDAERIIGNFEFSAAGDSTNLMLTGNFNISASASTVWDCDFINESISNCRFISDNTGGPVDMNAVSGTSLSILSNRPDEQATELPSESLVCYYSQAVGADNTLSLGIQYLSGPNTVAFALYFENPIAASPFYVVTGQQGRVNFEVVSGSARYGNTLNNGEVAVMLEDLPSPSELSNGDVISLKGKLLLNDFTLPLEYSWAEDADLELALLAGTVDVDCEAEYKILEAVF